MTGRLEFDQVVGLCCLPSLGRLGNCDLLYSVHLLEKNLNMKVPTSLLGQPEVLGDTTS